MIAPKKLTDTLYELAHELYAEQRDGAWYTSNEAGQIIDGPFATLRALMDSLSGTVKREKVPAPDRDDDLVTLREAAALLGRSFQGLYGRQERGTLGVAPIVRGRSITLYSLKALKEGGL